MTVILFTPLVGLLWPVIHQKNMVRAMYNQRKMSHSSREWGSGPGASISTSLHHGAVQFPFSITVLGTKRNVFCRVREVKDHSTRGSCCPPSSKQISHHFRGEASCIPFWFCPNLNFLFLVGSERRNKENQGWANEATFVLNRLRRMRAERRGIDWGVQDQDMRDRSNPLLGAGLQTVSPCNRNWGRSFSMEWHIFSACFFWKLTLFLWYSGGVFWFPWYPSLCSVYFQRIFFNTGDKNDEQSSHVTALL